MKKSAVISWELGDGTQNHPNKELGGIPGSLLPVEAEIRVDIVESLVESLVKTDFSTVYP
eukprot:scaffold21258_cov58-Cyclotella_meneghiniana.AAC.1